MNEPGKVRRWMAAGGRGFSANKDTVSVLNCLHRQCVTVSSGEPPAPTPPHFVRTGAGMRSGGVGVVTHLRLIKEALKSVKFGTSSAFGVSYLRFIVNVIFL